MADDRDPHVPPRKAKWFVYTEASSLGIEIVVAVSFGAIGGYYIERYLTHWSPWTMLLGFAFGIVVAVRAVLRTSRAYQAALRRDAAAMTDAPADPPADPQVSRTKDDEAPRPPSDA